MKPRTRRMAGAICLILGSAAGVGLILAAFNENLLYAYTPTETVAGLPPKGQRFRLGGLVMDNSVRRSDENLQVQFELTDHCHSVTVYYDGILPDLFRERQGIVANGYLRPDGHFAAEQVLAKHDENYMPPEVAQALEQAAALTGGECAPSAHVRS